MKRYLTIALLASTLVGCPGDKSQHGDHDGHDHDSHQTGDGHDGAPVTTGSTVTETKAGN